MRPEFQGVKAQSRTSRKTGPLSCRALRRASDHLILQRPHTLHRSTLPIPGFPQSNRKVGPPPLLRPPIFALLLLLPFHLSSFFSPSFFPRCTSTNGTVVFTRTCELSVSPSSSFDVTVSASSPRSVGRPRLRLRVA